MFLDSYQLRKCSLEAMVNELADEDFVYTKKAFGSDEKFALIKRKDIFPYSMLNDIKQLTKYIATELREIYVPSWVVPRVVI